MRFKYFLIGLVVATCAYFAGGMVAKLRETSNPFPYPQGTILAVTNLQNGKTSFLELLPALIPEAELLPVKMVEVKR